MTAGISPRRGWPGHLPGAPRPRPGAKPRPPAQTLPGSRHRHFSYSCCIFLPQEHLNSLKRAWEGGPTVIHLCALDDSASLPSCCFAGGFFLSLHLQLSLALLRSGCAVRKLGTHNQKSPVLGVKLGRMGRLWARVSICSPSGNILNNSSTTAQAGNVIDATPRPYSDLVRFPCTQWSLCIQFWALHITYVDVCDHHCQDGEQLSKAFLPLLLF